ncbi:MAG: NADH-quinone oxidoreductase subunit H [Acidobacteria bacterium]|nr:NADH-quinone oxidoreductase subunit H [Acidobacteriota bacterium]
MTAHWWNALAVLPALLLSPLLLGIIGKTKALAAGRKGAPLLQPYRDLLRLLGKGAVYGRTATWVFRAAPAISLAAILTASLMLSAGPLAAPLAFSGDLVLFAYLLALSRFALIAGAMDTGSAFEGMGASREAAFSAFAEPAFFLVLGVLAWEEKALSLSAILGGADVASWSAKIPSLALAATALFLILLAENSRIPVDDPATHLELTMIHEVMVLDHSGPDLAFILYGSALKLWLFSAVLVSMFMFSSGPAWVSMALFLGGMFGVAVLVGVTESVMARLRLGRVPQLLGLAAVLAGLAALLLMAGGRP